MIELLVLLDVTPLILGLEIERGKMSTITKRNTTLPCRNSITLYIWYCEVNPCIKVFQGERELTKDNQFLEKFTIYNIRNAWIDEVVSIEITFELDINKILIITAREIGSDNKKELTIKCDNDILIEDEIDRFIEEAEKLKNDDFERVRRVDAKLELEKFLIDLGKKVLILKNLKLKKKLMKLKNGIDIMLMNLFLFIKIKRRKLKDLLIMFKNMFIFFFVFYFIFIYFLLI